MYFLVGWVFTFSSFSGIFVTIKRITKEFLALSTWIDLGTQHYINIQSQCSLLPLLILLDLKKNWKHRYNLTLTYIQRETWSVWRTSNDCVYVNHNKSKIRFEVRVCFETMYQMTLLTNDFWFYLLKITQFNYNWCISLHNNGRGLSKMCNNKRHAHNVLIDKWTKCVFIFWIVRRN